MSEQTVSHAWLGRSMSVILTIFIVAGGLAFAFG